MTAPTVPGYPYGPVYINGQRVSPKHALEGDRQPAVCRLPEHPGCGALVVADGPLAGRDWAPWDNYDGVHRWNVRRHRAVRRVS